MADIYRHADAALAKIIPLMESLFQRLSTSVKFDELHVIEARDATRQMYRQLDMYTREQLKRVIRKAYREALKEAGGEVDGKIPAAALLAGYLKAYDGVTNYVYDREWARKRDRCWESLISAPDAAAERALLKRAMNLTGRQIQQAADEVTDKARRDAFIAAGVEEVEWVTERDDRVCEICRSREGDIYPIEDIPPKPHPRCRCWVRLI